MNTQEANLVKEALTRDLEHHIEELCDILIKDINKIKDTAHVTVDNFSLMTYMGESLEMLCDGTESIIAYLAKLKVAEKLISASSDISFKIE